ncbi:MAG: radical SAM protein [Thermoplasmata archaeon]
MRLARPDAVWIWGNSSVREKLSWYYQVMTDRMPSRFVICKKVAVEGPLEAMRDGDLWRLHERASRDSRDLQRRICKGEESLRELQSPYPSFLDLKVELVFRMLKACSFCEWRCGIDRAADKFGVCKLKSTSRLHSAFHHFGEESPLIGENQGGSGTIFFSGCTFHCVFCQNYDCSLDPESGRDISPMELSAVITRLRREGVANVNFVGGDPVPNMHNVLAALNHTDVNVPTVWNSNMYSSDEGMKLLLEVTDFWLPDFKFGNDECARRLARVKDYVRVVGRNHLLAYEGGNMIVRHLVMPNHLDCCTKPVLDFLAEKMPGVLVNVMDQYYPANEVVRDRSRWKDISRRLRSQEAREAWEYARTLGLDFEAISMA